MTPVQSTSRAPGNWFHSLPPRMANEILPARIFRGHTTDRLRRGDAPFCSDGVTLHCPHWLVTPAHLRETLRGDAPADSTLKSCRRRSLPPACDASSTVGAPFQLSSSKAGSTSSVDEEVTVSDERSVAAHASSARAHHLQIPWNRRLLGKVSPA